MVDNGQAYHLCIGKQSTIVIAALLTTMHASLVFAYDPKYDLDDNMTITHEDWRIIASNWTGEIRDGSGTSTPLHGDFDGDADVDDMDMLEFAENRGEGPLCVGGYPDLPVYPSVTPAILQYDPATGNVLVDTRATECYVAAYAITSRSGSFRIEHLVPVHLDTVAYESKSHFQLGASVPTPIIPRLDRFRPRELGRILPPLLDEQGFAEAVTGAWFAPFSKPRVEFERVILPMPSLGDTDRDSDVDSLDLLNQMANWTGAATEPGEFDKIFDEGDFDFDADVDSNDMLILMEGWTGAGIAAAALAELNPSAAGAAVAVPEPSSLAAALAGCAAVVPLLRRRRRSKRRAGGVSPLF